MTVEEKAKALRDYCDTRPCANCKLFQKVSDCRIPSDFLNSKFSECEIVGAYELVFGKGEIEMAELKEAAIIPDTIHIDKVENLHLTINHFNYEED